MVSSKLKDTFLQLIRLGIGTSKDAKITNVVDWIALKTLADAQGLTAIVLDGFERFKSLNVQGAQGPDQQFLLQWIGEVMQGYDARYIEYEKSIGSLAEFYNQHGYKMMVLKGYACSLDWPIPKHRPCGDIDIWQFGEQKKADAALDAWFKSSRVQEFKIDSSHHHHTVFEWQGFSVENHYDFINVHHHRSHVKLEKEFKKLGSVDSYFVSVNGERVFLPSPNLHALFLLKHAALHFVGTELTFRQILDWAFFVQKHGKIVDWDILLPIIEDHGLSPFLNIINAICVENLGFDDSLFPTVQFNPNLKERVLNEVFNYKYSDDNTNSIIRRQINRFQRWKGNAWKHELCYKESMWSAFWSGVWGHLIKPKSL